MLHSRRWILFLVLALGLCSLLVFSAPYYWTVPQVQHVSICYTAASASDLLPLYEAHDLASNREYQPESFGASRYPIQIGANSCIEATELALTSLGRRDLPAHGLGVTVGQKSDQQHITLRLNDSKKSSSLADDDGIPNTEKLSVGPGAAVPESLQIDPWGRKWMTIVKWAAIVLGSGYLAFIILGITDMISRQTDQ